MTQPTLAPQSTDHRWLTSQYTRQYALSTVVRWGACGAVCWYGSRLISWLTGTPQLQTVATVGAAALGRKILGYVTPRYGESTREMMGRWLLKIPAVRQLYYAEVNKEYDKFCEEMRRKWEQFGSPIERLPDAGYSERRLLKLLASYVQKTSDPLRDVNLSGTIYGPCLQAGSHVHDTRLKERFKGTRLQHAMDILDRVLPEAFRVGRLWNPLHADEFPIGSFIEYQVVRMVGSMFGADPTKVAGFVTSGGTESLMQAAYGYRQWGRAAHGHGPGESVIIVPDTIHAALDKAGEKFDIQIVKIPTDEHGRVDLDSLKAAVKLHGRKVVAVFCSAPSYPTGMVDPIPEIAAIAKENGSGCHVDSCLGGFVFKEKVFDISGVTSVSADTHKNGHAPKGSSVLVCRTDVEQNVPYHSVMCAPSSRIGVYATPRNPGSQSVMPALHAFLTMLAIGKRTYEETAEQIKRLTRQVGSCLGKVEGIRLLGDANVNVVAFKIDEKLGLSRGATYALAEEMHNRGYVLNNLPDDVTHLCVTARTVHTRSFRRQFIKALSESLEAVKTLDAKVKAGQAKFPSKVQMYCTVGDITDPSILRVRSPSGLAQYAQNVVLGPRALDATLRQFYAAQQNPYVRS